MTAGERAVWAAVYADRWRHEQEVGMKRHRWAPADAARECAMAASEAVTAMRRAPYGSLDSGCMDEEAAEMLNEMLRDEL